MIAGMLKYILKFYKPVYEKTSYGSKTKVTYEYAFTTRGSMNVVGGSKDNENGEIVYNKKLEFVVRYYVPVENEMQLEYAGQRYNIISIIPDTNKHQKLINVELINT